MSKPYDLFENQPKGPTALWNRFGVGRDTVYMYSKALYRASLSLRVASEFDRHANKSDEFKRVLTLLEGDSNRELVRAAQTDRGIDRISAIDELKSKANASQDMIINAIQIIGIRKIASQEVGALTAGRAKSIAAVLRLPVQYENEPKPSNEFYNGNIRAAITLGPGHFYTRRYLDTPGFQHLCSFHSLSEVLAAMKSTGLDNLIQSIDDDKVEAKLQDAAQNGCRDLLSAHLFLLGNEKTTNSDKTSLKAAAEQEIIRILGELNDLFDKEIKNESKIIQAEQIYVGGMAAGYTLLALSAVGIAVFASPDLLVMIGVSSIQGVDPAAVVTMLAAIAVFCAVAAIAASVAASNNPGNEARVWPSLEKILCKAEAPKRPASEESVVLSS